MSNKKKGSMSPAAIERAAKEREAIRLRLQGLSFDEIAQRLGMANRSVAHKTVRRGLERWMRATDDELRGEELERSQALIARLWPLVDRDDPDLDAMDRLLRVLDYRARIAGLYAPRKQQVDLAVATTKTVTSSTERLDAAEQLDLVVNQVLADRPSLPPSTSASTGTVDDATLIPDEVST